MAIRKVKGTIVRILDHSPLRDTPIEIWDRDLLLDDKIASGLTDDDGVFEVQYDTLNTENKPDLTLKVLRLSGSSGGYEVVYEEDGPRNVSSDFDFQLVEIAGWEYDDDKTIPLVYSPDAGFTSSPQNFVFAQTAKLGIQGFLLKRRQKKAAKQATLAAAQNEFEPNKTINMEKANPGSTRTDGFFMNALLNGFAPAHPTHNRDDDTYHVRYNIDDYLVDHKANKHEAPSVHLTLERSGSDLVPKSIEYQVRVAGSNPPKYKLATTATPGSDAAWEQAKFYFRIAELIDGQVKGHLGRGHINVGQYAIAFYRNIQKSPIMKLLHPHLKGVSAINTLGKDIIFGADGILSLSPLTTDSLKQVMRDDLGQCDWKEWSPRKSLSPKHTYAEIQKRYWNHLVSHVDSFFQTHGPKIVRDWTEVFHMSEDLVDHSVPFVSPSLATGEEWYDQNEISSDHGTRGAKAISLITSSQTGPSTAEVDNLKQMCAYIIYHATIWHDWRNDGQNDYAGELEYARLSINYTPVEAALQLLVVNLLVKVKHGYITRNEEGDIPAGLVERLRDDRNWFNNLDYDVRNLRSRINI